MCRFLVDAPFRLQKHSQELGLLDMGDCQNYGPFLAPYYSTAPNIWGTQKGIIIVITAHMLKVNGLVLGGSGFLA